MIELIWFWMSQLWAMISRELSTIALINIGIYCSNRSGSTLGFCSSNYNLLLINSNYLKFSGGDGPNLSRVKKVNVISTFYWNYISVRRLTLVSSKDIITIKSDNKNVKNHKKINKQKRLFLFKNGPSNGQKGNELRSCNIEKKIICKYSLFIECFKAIIIPWDFFCHED